MSKQLAEEFIQALQDLEASRNTQSIITLFADECEVSNVVSPRNYVGKVGAQDFWQNYRDTFDQVQSRFRNTIVMDGKVALEWTTEGTVKDGAPIQYDGVSILETQAGKIIRFCAYFDPNHLGHQMVQSKS
ncbi:MAG: nuclear transport factor 2 family protein [Saprospiraceae bacterium]